MKKLYFLLLLACANIGFSQCYNYNQLLTSPFRNMLFFDENFGFAYGQGTLSRTINGGDSWAYVEVNTASYHYETLYTGDIANATTAVIGGYKTLLRTTDKGETWNAVPLNIEGIVHISGIDFVDSQTGYLMAAVGDWAPSHFLYKTIDGGLTWSQISTNFTDGITNLDKIAIKFVDQNVGFGWAGQYLMKTTDGGSTWQGIADPNLNLNSTSRVNGMKVAENENLVIVVHNYGMPSTFFKSSDEGTSWSLIEDLTFGEGTSVESPVFEVVGNKLLFVSYVDVGVRAFGTFSLENDTIESSNIIDSILGQQTAINFVNADTGYIVDIGNVFWSSGAGRKTLKTIDGGTTWEEKDSFSWLIGLTFLDILQNSDNTYTLAKKEGAPGGFGLYVSTDDGASWTEKFSDEFNSIILLRADGNNISFLADIDDWEFHTLYESDDLGVTWESGPVGTLNGNFNYQMDGEGNLWYVSFGDTKISMDKGLTWSEVPLPDEGATYLNKFHIGNTGSIYAYGKVNAGTNINDYYIYQSDNLGQSWEILAGIDVSGQSISYTTAFNSEKAFVFASDGTYHIIDLESGNYEMGALVNPLEEPYVIPQGNIEILTESSWIVQFDGVIHFTSDYGQSWTQLPCLVCGSKMRYDEDADEILTFNKDNGVERLKYYTPAAPVVLGETAVSAGDIETYFAPFSIYGEIEWTLESGGILVPSADNAYATVNWTSDGQHVLKANYVDECGESAFYELIITVGQLNLTDHQLPRITVSPNPFGDTINVIEENLADGSSNIRILSITGQEVFRETLNGNPFSIDGLSRLSQGIYFLSVEKDGRTYMKKIVKE